MKSKKIISLILILIVGMQLIGCTKKTDDKKVKSEVKNVVVAELKNGKISNLSELSGTLKPTEEVLASFETGGRIIDLNKIVGEQVSVGDILAVLDDKDYVEKVAQANAGVEQSAAGLRQIDNGARTQDLAQARNSVEKLSTVYNQALTDLNRISQLYNDGVVAKTIYEQAQNTVNIAKKDLDSARQGYSLTSEGARSEVRDQSEAGYKVAVSAREQANLALEKTKLKAPISGTIIDKIVEKGLLVTAGTAIYKIGNIDTLKVIIPVPDQEINLWKKGDKVTIKLYASTREGSVTNILSATNENTGTIGVEVSIDNPQHDWLPGQVISCTHKVDGKDGLFVPTEALINTGDSNPYVFINVKNKAIKVSVKIGTIADNKIEITSGLKEGDQLIVKGSDQLLNNQDIIISRGDKQ